MTFFETFLYALVGQIFYILAAVVLLIVGWCRLRVHNRTAASWLIAGLATFMTHSILSALSIGYSNFLMVQVRERGGLRSDLGPKFAVIQIFLMLLLIFSLVCLVMAAIAGRRNPDLVVAPSNNSLQRP